MEVNETQRARQKEIPDSLLAEFTTKENGRKVTDGMGITPDIEVEDEEYCDLLATLLQEKLNLRLCNQILFLA